jgi:hypothetical protein
MAPKRRLGSSLVLQETRLETLRRERVDLARKRARTFGGPKGPGLPGLTFLETSSVQAITRRDYDIRFSAFMGFCREFSLPWDTSEQLDIALAEWFEILFFDGWDASTGTKGLAAVRFHLPRLGQVGATLPRAQRAIKGWIKRAPAKMRPPIPWYTALLIIGHFLRNGRVAEALYVLIGFWLYLRPRENSDLRADGLLPPIASVEGAAWWIVVIGNEQQLQPAKSGSFDEAVALDMPDFQWVGEFLQVLKRCRRPDQRLWPFTHEEMLKRWQAAVQALGLGHLHLELYALRHGGASHDVLTGRRDSLAVQRRGRWRSNAMVRRYEKHAKVQRELGRLTPQQLRLAQVLDARLAEFFRAPSKTAVIGL